MVSENFQKSVTLKVYGMVADGRRAQPVLGMGREQVVCAGKGGRLGPGML